MSKPFITSSRKSTKAGWKVPKHETNHEADIDSVVLDDAGEIVYVEGTNYRMARRILHVLKTAEGVSIDGRKVESPNLERFFYSYFPAAKVTFVDGSSLWTGSSILKQIAYMRKREDEPPCPTCKTEGLIDDELCPTCGGSGYLVKMILGKEGNVKGWLCTECAKEGRPHSFMVNTGVTYHKVTAMRGVYEGDDLTYEDYETEAPYVHFRCAWGHHETDGY